MNSLFKMMERKRLLERKEDLKEIFRKMMKCNKISNRLRQRTILAKKIKIWNKKKMYRMRIKHLLFNDDDDDNE